MSEARRTPPEGAWKALAEQVVGRPLSGVELVAALDGREKNALGFYSTEWWYEGEEAGACVFRRRRAGAIDEIRRVVVKGVRP